MDKGFLSKEVIITSVTTKMEIWDKSLYEAALDSLDDEMFLQILSEIK